MPWTLADAFKHTKKANTPKKKKAWARIANKERRIIGDAGAIRVANNAVKRMV